jgi:hypothetical protein
MRDLAHRVTSQTERRVFDGETVPAAEKLVSIFEPHTDITIKDNRETQFGHKLCPTSCASGLVIDALVEQGNPADSTLAVKMMERHQQLFGRASRQACFDGGFASRSNPTQLRALGIKDVAFNQRCRLEIADMVRSRQLYRKPRAFRAGVEGRFPSSNAWLGSAVVCGETWRPSPPKCRRRSSPAICSLPHATCLPPATSRPLEPAATDRLRSGPRPGPVCPATRDLRPDSRLTRGGACDQPPAAVDAEPRPSYHSAKVPFSAEN